MGTPIEKKSPLKNKPLRMPGQSLEKQLNDVLWDRVVLWLVIPVLLIVLTGLEWYRWAFGLPLAPWFYTAVTVASIPLAYWRIRRVRPILRQMQQGLEGERVVGQLLERLRTDGYDVVHDIPGDGHNIDHVLVGPGGVFAIETKTVSKAKGDVRVIRNGNSLTVAGLTPDRDPIAQARAAAQELGQIIRDRCGFDVSVRPVVLYPGWYTQNLGKSEVWVLNENVLPKWLANEEAKLSDAQIRQIGTGIARHVWDAEE